MNIDFKELRCPCCSSELRNGMVHLGQDTQMTKKCTDCNFWMIVVLPNNDYNYSVERELKVKTD